MSADLSGRTDPDQQDPDQLGEPDVVVVGGGPAGLAAAAELGRAGARVVVLDAGDRAGSSWAAHYDSLRLNTVAWTSHLPGVRFGRRAGPYPGRDQVVDYLARYVDVHGLDVRWSSRVERIERGDGGWVVRVGACTLRAPSVVVATGSCARPRLPSWAGGEGFAGRVLHSSRYRNAAGFVGRRVLVVGAGNSGGEIAADLAAGGAASVHLSVRSAPQIVPRRVLGVPTVLVAIGTRRLPARVGDTAVALLRGAVLGDLARFGLTASDEPLSERYARSGVVPLSHPGFFAAVRGERISVVPAVEAMAADGVRLADGRVLDVDDVVVATGFENGLAELLGGLDVLDSRGRPRGRGGAPVPGAPGLFTVGFTDPLSGNLREIRLEARRIGRAWRSGRQARAGHSVGDSRSA